MVQDQQLDLTSSCTLTLQGQIREMLINAILAGRLRAGDPVPSTRAMAAKLKVSRNTVAFAYQVMVTGGFSSSIPPQMRLGVSSETFFKLFSRYCA